MTEIIHVSLRVHAGTNLKGRPDWFSKELCVQSLLDAVAVARARGQRVETTAIWDEAAGPRSSDIARLLERFDRVRSIHAGSSRKSLQRQIAIALDQIDESRHLEEQFVYMVEDDHLHHPDSVSAIGNCPADYGLLYSLSKNPDREIGSGGAVRWVETIRGVSSFAVRASALRRDRRVHALMAYAGPAFDMLTWHVLSGRGRLTYTEILAPLRPRPPFSHTSPLKTAYQIAWRIIASAWSTVRRQRMLVATEPSLATHAEAGWLTPDGDWTNLALNIRSAHE